MIFLSYAMLALVAFFNYFAWQGKKQNFDDIKKIKTFPIFCQI